MNMTKFKPIIVLAGICMIVAVLLAGVNMLAAPIIKEREEQKIYDSFRVVLDGTFEDKEIPEGAPESITAMYKVTENGSLKGHVVTVVRKGYASDIYVTVGIDADGKVTKAVVTSQAETHGKGGMADYPDNFAGKDETTAEEVETFTGATVSSTAIKNAIIDALKCVSGTATEPEEKPIEPAREESEIISLSKELVEGSVDFEQVELEDAPKNLIRLYKETSGKGYIMYIVVPGDYVPVATEAIVHVDMNGKIVKTNLLQWVVGHGVEVGDFANGFNGKDNGTVGDVELVSGATGTSSDFRNAVKEALEFTTKIVNQSDEKLLELADKLVGENSGFETVTMPDGAPETLKKIFKEKGGKGYVLHIAVPGDYVPVATEALVYVDNDGTIKNINLMQWVVGNGIEPGDFANGFNGKDEETVGDVELVSGATGTSKDFRNAVKEALEFTTKIVNQSDEKLLELADKLVSGNSGFETVTKPDGAPETLKKIFKEKGGKGYVLHIAAPGEYVPVATEALVYVDNDGTIKNINLMQWVIGRDIEPGDFASGFIGKNLNSVETTELVSGATVTAIDFRVAVKGALESLDFLIKGEEAVLMELLQKLTGGKEFTELEIPSGAPSTLVNLYKVGGGRGYVAHVVVAGEYVTVATEAYVHFDSLGKIKNVNLVKWVVGHGVEAGDFANGFIGKTEKDIETTELVSGATGTSKDFRTAIAEIMPYIPKDFPVAIAVGTAILVLAVVSFVAYAVITNKKRRGI